MSPRSAAVPRQLAGRAVSSLLMLLAAAAALVLVQIPGANGAFLAKISNSTNTAATNPWFTCTSLATATIPDAYFVYSLGENALTTTGGTAKDVSGSGNPGSYSLAGVTGGQTNAGACKRDSTTSVSLSGGTGNADSLTSAIAGPTVRMAGPTDFTEEIWFKTSTTTGGNLISFGDARTGTSVSNDRHLYLDNAGHVVFGVFPGTVVNIVSPSTYNNGAWHFAAASLSSTSGMSLYVDGVQVNTSTNKTAQSYSGYWRIGFDNLNAWGTPTPTTYHYSGQLAWASVYLTALSSAQIAQQYAAGT